MKLRDAHIPINWSLSPISALQPIMEAGKSVNSTSRRPTSLEMGILKTSCVTGCNFDPSQAKAVVEAELGYLKCSVKGAGIIISRMNTPHLVGACGYSRRNFPNLFLPDRLWQLTFPSPDRVCAQWLYYHLASPSVQQWFGRVSTGTSNSMKNLTRGDVLRLIVPVPPFPEQHEIASILGTWDRGIESLTQLFEARTRHQRGLRQHLLTGETRLPEFNDQPWVECHLGDVLTSTPRKVPKPNQPFLGAGIRCHGKGVFLKPNFEPTNIALDELFEMRTDDLIVNITFAWEGAVAIVPPNASGALVSHRFPTFTFNPDQAMPRYFHHLIRTKRFTYDCGLASPGGAGRNRVLNKREFLKTPIRVPQLPEQHRIAEILDAGEREIALLNRQLETLRTQKRGLMQKLLTGEWRVHPEPEIADAPVSAKA